VVLGFEIKGFWVLDGAVFDRQSCYRSRRPESWSREWGMIADGGTLHGRIFFHRSDDSEFTAKRF
jgi:hypothetical protein